MNFGQAISEVLAITKRPDKQAETKSFLNAALSWYCNLHDWPHSLVEFTHPAPTIDQYVNTLDLTNPTYFTRFRTISYIRPTSQRFYINKASPGKIITEKGCELTNVWYRAGTKIVYSISVLNNSLEIGYQPYPPTLTANNETHWILDEVPYMAIFKATADVFDSAGNKEESDRFNRLALAQFTAFRDKTMGLG